MKISNLLIGVVLLSAACSSTTRKTPKGYEYDLVKEGSGEVAKVGEYLMVDMVFKDGKDSVWTDSRGKEIPMLMAITEARANDEGIEEIFRALRKGDSVTCSIPAKILFEKTWGQPLPPQVDSTSSFTFNIGVKDILNEEQIKTLEEELMAKLTAEQIAIDTVIIDSYLKEAKIEAKTTPSGLRYQITKNGKGNNAETGQEVSIHYAGYLMDGTLFDTSIESISRANNAYNPDRPYEPLKLVAGQGRVIKGWEEAIMLMNKGSKLRVWIPSSLAYGPQRRSAEIKENSILVFDMEMIDIK